MYDSSAIIRGVALEIEPLSAALGACVRGVEIPSLTASNQAELREAFLEHQVLFFPGLSPSAEEHKRLAAAFGSS